MPPGGVVMGSSGCQGCYQPLKVPEEFSLPRTSVFPGVNGSASRFLGPCAMQRRFATFTVWLSVREIETT